jgi:hypothetical protein
MEDAFFYVPQEGLRKLNDEAIANIRATAKDRALQTGILPEPSCRWIDGQRREVLETKVRAVLRWAEPLAKSRTKFSIDLEIDAYFHALANLLLLEEVARLSSVLLSMADAFRAIGGEDFQHHAALAQVCERTVTELHSNSFWWN